MSVLALVLVALCSGTFAYAYAAYPALLWLATRGAGNRDLPADDPERWPDVSISLPAYNEEDVIEDTLRRLLELDYPEDRMQILVVSDASTDRTDSIVRSFEDSRVELLRLDDRGGKTEAENAGAAHLTGEIVVNTDASTRIPEGSLKPLIRAFRDPDVGVASGRDLSVGREESDEVRGESGYVGFEMWLRELETRLHSIVGASGCFYAIRRQLHQEPVPGELSRDFMAALRAREAGFRAVSVRDAVALVPRARSLRSEARRKARTMLRGLATLWYKRHLLNPLRWGAFAWMLFSHKLARWLVPLTLPGAILGIGWLAAGGHLLPTLMLAFGLLATAVAAVALRLPNGGQLPGPLGTIAYVTVSLGAGVVAWGRALARESKPVWEPTRR